jgi:hypothetical protein
MSCVAAAGVIALNFANGNVVLSGVYTMAKIYLFQVTQGGQGKHSSDCHASLLLALSL